MVSLALLVLALGGEPGASALDPASSPSAAPEDEPAAPTLSAFPGFPWGVSPPEWQTEDIQWYAAERQGTLWPGAPEGEVTLAYGSEGFDGALLRLKLEQGEAMEAAARAHLGEPSSSEDGALVWHQGGARYELHRGAGGVWMLGGAGLGPDAKGIVALGLGHRVVGDRLCVGDQGCPSSSRVRVRTPVQPEMPEAAKRQGGYEPRRCALTVTVDASGVPMALSFVECPDMFRDSAMEALMQWRFTPARADGVDVASEFNFTITYQLSGGRGWERRRARRAARAR